MTSSHDRWNQVQELFSAALKLSPNERESLFHSHSLNSDERREIEELLQAHDEVEASGEDGFLKSPAAAHLDALVEASENSHDPLGISGRTISHFHVKDFLAAGGMGVLYTALDEQLNRTVALKFPLPHQQMNHSVKERFIREARSTAVLNHPNLCTVYEVGESPQGIFIAMPLYEGETLRDRLQRERTLPLTEAIRIVREVATGLASAHAAGIIHRDMKPGNVMLLPDGAVKILDFGIAKAIDATLTESRDTLGTLAYMAPEQIRRDPVDGRTDLWGVGVMLYRMLTGELPFQGETEIAMLHSILNDEPQRKSSVDASIKRVIDTVAAGLLQKRASDRYANAEALLADLDALERGKAPAHKIPMWKRGVRKATRAPLFVASAGLVLLTGVLIWIGYQRSAAVSNESTAPTVKFVNNTAVIPSSAELIAALSPANTGKNIHLRAGTYYVDRPLTVPDGMTVEGEGVMTFAREGYATGFRDGPRTTLRMAANVGGDVLTLGNGVTLRNLEIVGPDGLHGNPVSVVSRGPADTVSASIIESVLLNRNPGRPAPSYSRGLFVITRNASKDANRPPDESSIVSVKLLRSVIMSPAGGGGFFAYNFAAKSRISLEVSRSLIGGESEANGGVSNPVAVHDSEVRVISRDNLYRNEWADPCTQPRAMGWNFLGGSGTNFSQQLPETARNRLIVRSTNDRIEGFTAAIVATGSRRFSPSPRTGPSTGNHIDLQLVGTVIRTPECQSGVGGVNAAGEATGRANTVSDLVLTGGGVTRNQFEPGDGNTVRAELIGVTGSGKRDNKYAYSAAGIGEPLAPKFHGRGNRVEIVGDPQTFSQINHAIDPAPPPQFFTKKR